MRDLAEPADMIRSPRSHLMKIPHIVGFLLIAFAVVSFAYQGFTYTTREKAIDIGPIQVMAEKSHFVSVPPALSAGALIAGIALLFMGRK